MENHLSQEFISYYEGTFKPVAAKCANGFVAMRQAENGEIALDDPSLDVVKKAVDGNAIWFIGLLLGDVEMAKFKGKRLNLLNSMSQVDGCLNSESYWANVWKGDLSSEEAKNLKELAGLTSELIQRL